MAIVKIKLFLTVKKFYEIIGICLPRSESNRKWSMFNIKNVSILIFLIQMFLASTAFVLFQAKTVFEYGFPTYVSMTLTSSVIYLFIQLWKIEDILRLMKTCDEFIEKSNCPHKLLLHFAQYSSIMFFSLLNMTARPIQDWNIIHHLEYFISN